MTSSSITLEEEQQRKCIEGFFYDDEPNLAWIPLPVDTFEQRSSCKVIIISQMILGGSNSGYYYCKLHPEIYYYYIHLDTIEHHHYKYNKEPEKHKSKILDILNGRTSSKRWPLRQSVLDRVAGYISQHGGVSIIQRVYVVVVEQICLLSIWLCQTKYKRRCK
jgi:hypothetical protein